MLFSRNPEKLEAKAVDYESRGKTRKAIKNRDKAARLRAKAAAKGHASGSTYVGAPVSTIPISALPTGATSLGFAGSGLGGNTTTTTHVTQSVGAYPANTFVDHDYIPRTPARYEQNALKWEQRGNWQKAQKNREKVWRLQNPQHASMQAPTFYDNNRFIGYNVPFTGGAGLPISSAASVAPISSGFQRRSYFGQNNRDPLYYENRAGEYQRLGNQKKALRYREKAGLLRTNNGVYTSRRTHADYERNALKWEQRGNFRKAQKNREKAWRLMNPQYVNTSWTAPNFYEQQRFSGYNVPNFVPAQTNFTTPSSYSYFTSSNSSYSPYFQNSGVTNASYFTKTGVSGVGGLAGVAAPIVHTTTNAPTIETHVHGTIVEQTTRAERITEIQPVIHREIDAPQVRVVEKHIYESVPSTGPSTITRGAIVEETVRPRIIEEIQPVVHREVPQTFVERVEQHVTEHVVLPTTQSKTVIDSHTQGISNLSLGQNRFPLAYPGVSSFHQYSQFGRTTRDVSLYQQRLAEYERLGNQKKAQRYREKIARLQGTNGAYTPHFAPADYERKALKWEQRGNWQKAQRNREKAWRLQNPQYSAFNTHPAPSFYDNGHKFLGYNQPIPTHGFPQQGLSHPQQGLPLGQQGLSALGQSRFPLAYPGVSSFHQYSQFGRPTRDVSLYQKRLGEYERLGNQKKAQRYREKIAKLQANNGAYTPHFAPADYERKALKWEQRGNWQKAQRNREKAWRLQNPQYSAFNTHPSPSFYDNGHKFLGYNQPIPTHGLSHAHQGLPHPQQGLPLAHGGAFGHSQFGLPKRDFNIYEQRAAEYEKRGKPAKANKLRQKANLIRQNNGAYTSQRTPTIYERNALKWEQRGNWQKAQKNREKAWRLQNPQYMSLNHRAPSFYNNGKFLGYSVPYNPQQQLQQQGQGQIQQQHALQQQAQAHAQQQLLQQQQQQAHANLGANLGSNVGAHGNVGLGGRLL